MIYFFEASLRMLSIHHVGVKALDGHYSLSMGPHPIDNQVSPYLKNFFLSPFLNGNEVFNFLEPKSNHIFKSVDVIFNSDQNSGVFHDQSQSIAKYLYEVSNHPAIHPGELYVAYFDNIQYQGEAVEAVGIFKSEHKETYLKVSPHNAGFNLSFENEGINIRGLDKGCLIINQSWNSGYTVLCADKGGSKAASYWKDDFLSLNIMENDFRKTDVMLSLCKDFIKNKLDEEFELSSTEKADLLNKSIKYFKEKETFDLEDFSNDVIGNPDAAESFKKYKSIYGEEFDHSIPDCFNISDAAVKKNKNSFKPVIKLDKNFTVYAHGSKDLIEKGFDEEKGMNFYKMYYKEEN